MIQAFLAGGYTDPPFTPFSHPTADTGASAADSADTAVIEMEVGGQWSRRLCMEVHLALRNCLAEHPSAIIIDLHGLADIDAASTAMWLAAGRAANLLQPAVKLVVCVPPTRQLASSLRRVGAGKIMHVVATMDQARNAVGERLTDTHVTTLAYRVGALWVPGEARRRGSAISELSSPARPLAWVDGREPPGPPETRPVPVPDPQRLLVGHFPSHAAPGSEIDLTVRITRNSVLVRDACVAALRPFGTGVEGTAVTILVDAGLGLTLLSPRQQQLHVPADADSDPVRFVLRASTVDLHRLRVTAWAGGTFLAELGFEVSVTTAVGGAGVSPKTATISTVRPDAGEVTLQVRRDHERYSFQLLCDSYLFDPVLVESLSSGPDAATEEAILTLRRLARGDASYTPGNARRWLQNTGVALWNNLIPEAIREQFWHLRSRITAFTIATGMDTVPWELLYPMSKTEDEDFLVKQFPVTRRVYNQPRAPQVGIGTPRFVVPPDSPRNAAAEVDAIQQILNAGHDPIVLTDLSDVLDRIDGGDPGLMHFACHNTYRPGSAGSSITMNGGDFVPTLLEKAKATEALASIRPMVFVNACRSDGAVPHYTRMMGWAQQFLAAGAGAFVGTVWDVRSTSAQAFAEEFYRLLKSGKTLGHSAWLARSEMSGADGDPTWLAYAVYGDPHAIAGII